MVNAKVDQKLNKEKKGTAANMAPADNAGWFRKSNIEQTYKPTQESKP